MMIAWFLHSFHFLSQILCGCVCMEGMDDLIETSTRAIVNQQKCTHVVASTTSMTHTM